MQESARSAKISGTAPERGHSCPQQLPNTQRDRNVRALYFRSTLLRTRMSALRFGSGSAGLGTDAPCYENGRQALWFLFLCHGSFLFVWLCRRAPSILRLAAERIRLCSSAT